VVKAEVVRVKGAVGKAAARAEGVQADRAESWQGQAAAGKAEARRAQDVVVRAEMRPGPERELDSRTRK
jgi:hypothetical protein